MSKYSSYVKKANQIARNTFTNYRQAEDKYKKAKEQAGKYPQRTGLVDGEYAAKSARALAELREAELEMKKAKDAFKDGRNQFKQIRAELADVLEDDHAATPDKLDLSTLELLKSGIMKASDYTRLFDKAKADNNYTMCKVIGKYAGDAAADKAKRSGESKEVSALRYVGWRSENETGDDRLKAFDNMTDLYNRCEANPRMIDYWDEFTSDTVENF